MASQEETIVWKNRPFKQSFSEAMLVSEGVTKFCNIMSHSERFCAFLHVCLFGENEETVDAKPRWKLS